MSSNWPSIVLLLFAAQCAQGAHFRGGSMSWKQVPGENKIRLTYKVDFTAKFGKDHKCTSEAIKNHDVLPAREEDDFIICKSDVKLKCSSKDNVPLTWICDGMDTAIDSSYGHNTIDYDISQLPTKFVISYQSSSWIQLQSPINPKGKVRGWRMLATGDLTPRFKDKINSSPISANIPTEKFYKGCDYHLRIPATDPDNDVVRCRYAREDLRECYKKGSSCGVNTTGLTINATGCILHFNTTAITEGYHGVNVIIEDFARPFNEQTSKPLSQVALLFLLNVTGQSTECKKPIIVNLPYCKVIRPGEHFEMVVRADAGDPSKPIDQINVRTGGITTMTVSDISDDPDTIEHPNRKIKTLDWDPTTQDIGDYSVCYSALDEDGYTSGISCTFIYVDANPLQPDPKTSTPGENGVVFAGATWTVRFNHKIQRPTTSSFIKIVNPENGIVFEIDASSSTSVTFSNNSIEFLPSQALSTDIQYKLQLEEGVAMRVAGGCGSVAAEWQISVQTVAPAETPPKFPTRPTRNKFVECRRAGTLELNVPKDVAEGQRCFIHLLYPSFTVVENGGVIHAPYNLCCPSSCGDVRYQ